jgi:hypothetical protein
MSRVDSLAWNASIGSPADRASAMLSASSRSPLKGLDVLATLACVPPMGSLGSDTASRTLSARDSYRHEHPLAPG